MTTAANDTLTITATVDAGTGGTTIGNTASVTASDQADGTPANDSDNVDITVQLVDLEATKTVDDGTPNEGQSITYTLTVTNSGTIFSGDLGFGTAVGIIDLLVCAPDFKYVAAIDISVGDPPEDIPKTSFLHRAGLKHLKLTSRTIPKPGQLRDLIYGRS